MLTVRPRRRIGVLFGAAVAFALLVAASALGRRVALEVPSFTSFTGGTVALLLLALALVFAYWTYGCWSLRYMMDRNALTIAWAGHRHSIPLASVTALVPAPDAPRPQQRRGLRWPGYFIGSASVPGATFPASVLVFSTQFGRNDLTYVVTDSQTYALSVPDRATFARELKLRARLGPTEKVEPGVHRWPVWDLPAWHDAVLVRPMAAALLLNVLLFAYLLLLMPGLPDTMPLQLTAIGAVGRVGPKEQLLALPAMGLALLIANGLLSAAVHKLEPLAAYLCTGAALAVQALLCAAALKLLG